MKKRNLNLRTLTLAGLTSGLIISSQANAVEKNRESTSSRTQRGKESQQKSDTKAFELPDANDLSYHLLTEEELLKELDAEGRQMYNSLSPEGKEIARKVASQYCNGQNVCRGLNACETKENKCMGQGSCQGKSKCLFMNKNQAVKVVYDKMKGKRQQAMDNRY